MTPTTTAVTNAVRLVAGKEDGESLPCAVGTRGHRQVGPAAGTVGARGRSRDMTPAPRHPVVVAVVGGRRGERVG